ncbi:MAG: tetratricopeptide repeat protein, partial [candidate division KSB1 bacterium]|nr:tetratricopeptide repeat protein [candidate division KSB1 bacterium]
MQTGGLLKLIAGGAAGTLAFVGALAGLLERLGVFKEEKAAQPHASSFDIQQTGATNIAGQTVNIGQIVQPPLAPPELHDTIGFVPPYRAETYIHRGQIEDEVREFLRKGNGTGAIVGLHAPGGLGKTELAKHAAEDLKGEFEGVLWLDVGEQTPEQVVAALLTSLGVQLPQGTPYEVQKNELHARLGRCRYLLILDDVRAKALAGLRDFLPPKPCAALLTSRIREIGGVQRTFELDHMTPEQADELLEAILGPETLAAEPEAAAQLAARCAYNPLALEIAARRIRQLQGLKRPIAHYFDLARQRFAELKMDGDARWDMERVFDLSYLDLSDADRARFRALGVFHPTGFAPEAAAFVWGVELPEARATLSRFINLSLVKIVPGERERYRLHDLLDEYAAEKLRQNPAEEAEKRNILAEWLITLFSSHFTDDRSTAPHVADERANLLISCEWAHRQKNASLLGRLVTQSRNWFYNLFKEDWTSWLVWLEACLQLGLSDKQLKANVLKAIGDVQQFRKEIDAALASYNEALKLFRQVGAKLGEANVLKAIGDVQQFRDERDAALASYNEALKLFRQVGDRLGKANVLQAIGDVQQFRDERDAALASYNEALKLFRQVGAKLGEANVLKAIGDVQQFRKEIDAALASYNEALKLFRQVGDRLGEANVLKAIGDVQQFRDERDA